MAKLFNRAKMKTATTGSGTVTLTTASDGYQTFAAAGVADSDVVQYVIEDGTSWEIGTGTYSATGTSLTRSPTESSNAGASISLTGAAEVFITAVAADLNRLQDAGSTKVEATSTGATVTGNIVVTGTVDGRDVAADGSKLDGIEAGATADQTKSDIDALGINADQVDGLEASQFLRSDADDSFTGVLDAGSGNATAYRFDGRSFSWNSAMQSPTSYIPHVMQRTYSGWDPVLGIKTTNGFWQFGAYSNDTLHLGYMSGAFGSHSTNGFDNSLTINPSTMTFNGNTVWHAGNDGSGSGLDADMLDGLHESSFMRKDSVGLSRALGWYPTYGSATESNVFWSDAEEAVALYSSTDTTIGMASKAVRVTQGQKYRFTVPIKSSAADTDGLYVRIYYYTGDLPDDKFAVSNSALHPNVQEDTGGDTGWYENSSHTTSWRNFVRTWTAPSTGYVSVVILNWTGFSGAVYAKQPDISLQEYSDLYVDDHIYHNGDTDTRLVFGANTITLQTGGSSEITVNTTGVRLGDTGNGYFQPVTGNYGSIQVDGGAHGGYEGYSIGGRVVFMHNNTTSTGIYNDVENEWLFYGVHNGYTAMYYNGSQKIATTSTGVTVTGDLNSTSDIRYKKNIEKIDNAVDKVKALRGVTFDWDNDAFAENESTKKPNFTERATGVIAQEVEKVLPEAVRTNEETGFKNVAYGNMVGLLIEAIKEQQTQIDALAAQVEELKRQ